MLRFLKQINGERGQALVIILVLLVLAGLMTTPTLGHAANTMISVRTIEKNVNGLYAAEAGVKYGLCNLELEPGPHQLPENINQMVVMVEVENKGGTSLHSGGLIQGKNQSNWVSVDTEIDDGVIPYEYKIIVTWQAEPGTPPILLKEVGGKLPLGYVYQLGSAAEVDDNIAKRDPIPPEELFEDAGGAYMLKWELETPRPSVSAENRVRTQTFQIDGEGNLEGYYAWIVAGLTGTVSEIAGTLYTITSTAIYPESIEPTCIIVCDVLVEQEDGEDDTKNIISWKVSK